MYIFLHFTRKIHKKDISRNIFPEAVKNIKIREIYRQN